MVKDTIEHKAMINELVSHQEKGDMYRRRSLMYLQNVGVEKTIPYPQQGSQPNIDVSPAPQ